MTTQNGEIFAPWKEKSCHNLTILLWMHTGLNPTVASLVLQITNLTL